MRALLVVWSLVFSPLGAQALRRARGSQAAGTDVTTQADSSVTSTHDDIVIGGATGRHSACINGVWLWKCGGATGRHGVCHHRRSVWTKKGNTNATLTLSTKAGWQMKAMGRCGRTNPKKGSSIVILKGPKVRSTGNHYGWAPYYTRYRMWKVRNSKNKFRSSSSLFMEPSDPHPDYLYQAAAVCVQADAAHKVGNRLRLKPPTSGVVKAIANYTCNDLKKAKGLKMYGGNTGRFHIRYTFVRDGVRHVPMDDNFEGKFTQAIQLCGRARSTRYLPKKLSGKPVLVSLGGKRFRTDNKHLKSSGHFLAYRIARNVTQKSGPSPGVKWGTTIHAIGEDSSWITVDIGSDQRCKPVVFEQWLDPNLWE